MASFQQMFYCKNCKKNISVDDKGHCKNCNSTQIKKSWSVRFLYINKDGIEVHKRLTGFQTKKEAQDALLEFNIANKTKNKKIEKNLSFIELYNEYEKYLKSRTKLTTHYDFISKCKNNVVPYFKDYNVIKITPKIILDWQNTLNKYSYKYKCHLRNCLSGMLKYAEKYYDIPNQLIKVDTFRRTEPKKEMQIWTPEEFNKVMENINNFEYKVFFNALYQTGARKGEILATSWEDWNFKNKTLNINKSVTKKIANIPWIITTPKNASSIRKIKLTDNLINLMKQLYKIKEENNTIGQFAFGNDSPLSDTTITRHLENAIELAEVKKIRIHDFRHSHASLLISQGVSIVAVAKRLGHSSIEQTLNTYAHLMPNEEDELIKKLENVI